MKHIETTFITIPNEILYNGDVNERIKKTEEFCREKISAMPDNTTFVYVKAKDAKMIIGFLSKDVWFIAGIPGKVKMIDLETFNPTNTWLYCYEAIERVPLVSELLAEVVNYLYKDREILFRVQNTPKNEQYPKIEVNVSKGGVKKDGKTL